MFDPQAISGSEKATYERFSSMANFMTCTIDDGKIYTVNFAGARTQIGVVNDVYNELTDLANSYYDLCVEHGIIEKEKTTEDVLAETQQVMQQMMQQMQVMQQELTALKQKEGTPNESQPHRSDDSSHFEDDEAEQPAANAAQKRRTKGKE